MMGGSFDDTGLSGFQPVKGGAAWGFSGGSPGHAPEEEEFLDDEERERVQNVELLNEDRKRQLYDKM
jgi:hypothetical protein